MDRHLVNTHRGRGFGVLAGVVLFAISFAGVSHALQANPNRVGTSVGGTATTTFPPAPVPDDLDSRTNAKVECVCTPKSPVADCDTEEDSALVPGEPGENDEYHCTVVCCITGFGGTMELSFKVSKPKPSSSKLDAYIAGRIQLCKETFAASMPAEIAALNKKLIGKCFKGEGVGATAAEACANALAEAQLAANAAVEAELKTACNNYGSVQGVADAYYDKKALPLAKPARTPDKAVAYAVRKLNTMLKGLAKARGK